MTSLKNRTYLNLKVKEWDENVIYPQAFVVIDLNNIKDINNKRENVPDNFYYDWMAE